MKHFGLNDKNGFQKNPKYYSYCDLLMCLILQVKTFKEIFKLFLNPQKSPVENENRILSV